MYTDDGNKWDCEHLNDIGYETKEYYTKYVQVRINLIVNAIVMLQIWIEKVLYG